MINIKRNKNIFLIIMLLISLFFTTTVYSAFNTQLQIRGEAVVRSEQMFRITGLKILDATNGAYETYSSKYDKDTTYFYATLPASSSMTYEIAVTNKNTSLIYQLKEILSLVNDNSNVKVKYSIKVGDSVASDMTKTFTITLTNSTSSKQVLTLITKYNFEIGNWTPLKVNYLSSYDSSSFNANKESDIFEVSVENLNSFNVNYSFASDNSLFTILVDTKNTNTFEIKPNTTVTHQIRVKLRDGVIYENFKENLKLMLKTTYPISSTIDIKTILLNLPQYSNTIILNSMPIGESPESFSDVESTNGLLLKINENSSYTYYFRGVVYNNYFLFADKLWRIVRIDSSGNIRLVLNDNVTPETQYTKNYISGQVENLEAAMPLVDYRQSNVKKVVDDWYAQNIAIKEESKHVVTSKFCVELSYQDPFETQYSKLVYYYTPYLHVGVDSNNFTPEFSCSEGSIFESPVGLLSAEEVLAAGSYWERSNDKYYLYNPNIPSANQTSWTMSASYYSINEKQAGVIVFNFDGKGLFDWVNGGNPGQFYGYRPVISINGNVLLSGDGTVDNPYQVLE